MSTARIVYDEREKRGFIRLNAELLLFTFLGLVFILVALAAVVVLPIVLGYVGLQSETERLVQLGRWPVLLIATTLALAAILSVRAEPSEREMALDFLGQSRQAD